MTDKLQRFVFDKLDARGAVVALKATCDEIQATHHYPPALARLLNQFSAAACLLRDSIKVDASVTIQLRSGGAIDLIMADCSSQRQVRAIAEYNTEQLPSSPELALDELSNDAVLAITITPDEGERYQGVVPIESANLEACLEDYFARSEQLPTWFRLLADTEQAVGIAIHALPSEEQAAAVSLEAFSRLNLFLKTLTEKEAFELSNEQILTRLFHEESCRLFEPVEVAFGCDCSAEKSLNAIASLGADEVGELIKEQRELGHTNLTVDCHFCFQRYEFELDEIAGVALA